MTTLIITLEEIHELLTTWAISPGIEIDVDKALAKEKQIAIIWYIEDVQEERPHLTDDQAWEVLQTVKREHDGTLGISWQTLRCYADMLFPAPPNQPAEE